MRPESRKLLWDAVRAADLISSFCAGKRLVDYAADEQLSSAVERQFEIIGEALGKFAKDEPDLADRIPELRRIVGFRNLLIHGYAVVDDHIVWGLVESKLSPLRTAIAALLGS